MKQSAPQVRVPRCRGMVDRWLGGTANGIEGSLGGAPQVDGVQAECDEPEAVLYVLPGGPAVSGEDAGRNPCVVAPAFDRVDGLLHLRVADITRHAEARGEIIGPDEDGVNAGYSQDGL